MRRRASCTPRAWLLCLLGATTISSSWIHVAVCWAGEPAVLIGRPASPSPLLNEVLIRMRGELAAAGLSTDTRVWERRMGEGAPVLSTDTHGAVVFEQERTRITIWAYAPDSAEPITLSLDSRARHVNAEVVAVRAVEALRAAIHRYAEGARERNESLPEAVTGFGESAAVEAESSPEQAGPSVAPAEAESAPQPATIEPVYHPPPPPEPPREPHWRFTLHAGPALIVEGGTPSGGVGGGVGADYGWFAVRTVLDGAMANTTFQAPSGQARARRTAGSLQVGGIWRPAAMVSVLATAGAGAAHYFIDGEAAAGFAVFPADHWSALAALRVGAQLQLLPNFGVFFDAEPSVAFDAPALRVAGARVAKLGQPAFVAVGGFLIAIQ